MSSAEVNGKPVGFKDKLCAFFAKVGGKLKRFFLKIGELIGFKQNKWKILVYGLSSVATIVTFSVLLAWASGGDVVTEIQIIRVSALATEDARTEYLVGETPSANGFALVIDGKIRSDCKVDVDTSTAGTKAARVYCEADNTTYEGTYPVTVFAVKHLDIKQMPTSVTVGEDGTVALVDAVIWAELSGSPKQLPVQTEHPDWTTTVVLSSEYYTASVEDASVSGGKIVTLHAGALSTSFVFVSINYVLDSPKRVVTFKNADENGKETLTLFVTKTESNGNDKEENPARGIYVYTNADGVVVTYGFAYYIVGYESHFISNSLCGSPVEEKQVGDDLQVKIDGHTFTAPHSAWTGAILTL